MSFSGSLSTMTRLGDVVGYPREFRELGADFLSFPVHFSAWQPCRLRTTTVLAALLLLAAQLLQAADWDFGVILQRSERLYGAMGAGRNRVIAWANLMISQGATSEEAKLRAVNDFFNKQLAFRNDAGLWMQDDYWATPVESLRQGAGDCEDYSIAKYFTLRQLGVSTEKLRITYVKALRLNQAHMVLTYYANPTAVPLVLDNLIPDIKPATQRNDLQPVYAFNADGLWVPGARGDKRVSDSKRLSRWQDVLEKMQAEGFPADGGY